MADAKHTEREEEIAGRYTLRFRSFESIAIMVGGGAGIQVVKVQEEAGELAGAWIAFTSANPRKPSGPLEDVQGEALHVAVAALVAYVAAGGTNPIDALKAAAEKAEGRIRRALQEATDG